MSKEKHELNTENINTASIQSKVNPGKEMTLNVEISENAEAKCSQKSVEFITSLPTTATNDVPSVASIHNQENRLFVSE